MPRFTLGGIVLDAPDPTELGRFYQRLLTDWTQTADEPTWVQLRPPGGSRPAVSFQYEPNYVRPVWPSTPDDPQMSAHLDIQVDDLDAAGAEAVAAGAVLADFQPQDDVRVYLDPAGHPFCLFVN
jgi:catechol 2,3-dioxygenase-like lactoylglutathione lyase family enzyme